MFPSCTGVHTSPCPTHTESRVLQCCSSWFAFMRIRVTWTKALALHENWEQRPSLRPPGRPFSGGQPSRQYVPSDTGPTPAERQSVGTAKLVLTGQGVCTGEGQSPGVYPRNSMHKTFTFTLFKYYFAHPFLTIQSWLQYLIKCCQLAHLHLVCIKIESKFAVEC